jgi:hypothetical protein
MSALPWPVRARHLWIRSRWRRWLFPLICSLPYLLSLFWLAQRGQIWIAQVLLAPLVMAAAIGVLTLVLARLEDGGRPFRR